MSPNTVAMRLQSREICLTETAAMVATLSGKEERRSLRSKDAFIK